MRLATRLITSLVLGFVTTVAVAWTQAYAVPISGWRSLTTRSARGDKVAWLQVTESPGGIGVLVTTPWQQISRPEGEADLDPSPEVIDRLPNALRSRTVALVNLALDSQSPYFHMTLEGRGWPIRSLWCEYQYVQSPGPSVTLQAMGSFETSLLRHKRFTWTPDFSLALPVRVLWFGLLADSAMFAATWALLLIGPGLR